MEYRVRFVREDREIAVPSGTTLLQARIDAGLETDAPCGGKGTCKKCVAEIRRTGDTGWQKVLMCQTAVDGDLEVRLPESGGKLRVLTDTNGADMTWNPMVRAVRLEVPPCPRGESSADWTRLAATLAEQGITVQDPDPTVCAGLGHLLAQRKGRVWAVVSGDRVLEVRADAPQRGSAIPRHGSAAT